MKQLFILRHAKSDWSDPQIADRDRPLNKRGKRDAPRMGRLLCENRLVPDVVLSSPAKRAMSTAEAVLQAAHYTCKIRRLDSLYMAGTEAYLNALGGLPERVTAVMVVGHNPGLEDFLSLLTDSSVMLPTAALAQVELPIDAWRELNSGTRGRLIGLWRPRDLN